MHERQKGEADWPRMMFYCKLRTKGWWVQPMWLEGGKIKLDPEQNQNQSLGFIGDASRVLERNKILQMHSLPAGK